MSCRHGKRKTAKHRKAPIKKILSLALLALLSFAPAAFAQYRIPPDGYCWVDEATGKPPSHVVPKGTHLGPDDKTASGGDRSFFLDSNGIWRDEATGKPPSCVVPKGTHLGPDDKTASGGDRSFVLVPCPQPAAAQDAGHTIKKILEHVSIGVGGSSGGDDRRFHHDDQHVTEHKTHTTDQHTSDRKPTDAQKNATASSDKNRAHDHKKPSPTPTPR